MIKKLALGALIAFAVFGIAVAASSGFEWWQNRSDTASRVVAAPVDPVTVAPTTTTNTPGTAPLEISEVSPQAEMDTRREAEQAVTQRALELAATTTTLHPQVQAQGWERVVAIVEGHSDAWPWIVQALDVAQISFFEDLPPECDSAIGCYHPVTGDIWLSLDALRERDPLSFSFFLDDRGPSDTVLHELAHAYTRSFPQGSDLLDLFGQHYAGCSSRGLDTDRLITELLADTMAMAVTSVGSSMPNDYGYFGSGGFAGCLVESSQPDEALFGAVYSTLFNCDSEHALDTYEHRDNPFLSRRVLSDDTDADFVLLTCYGIDCITPSRGCESLTEFDARRAVAAERIRERQCSDGLLITGAATLFSSDDFYEERPGWEAWCEDFVPDDVECIAGHYEYEPGLLNVSGECIVPNCTVEGPQGEPQPGYREYTWGGDCIAIDRPESQNSDTNG